MRYSAMVKKRESIAIFMLCMGVYVWPSMASEEDSAQGDEKRRAECRVVHAEKDGWHPVEMPADCWGIVLSYVSMVRLGSLRLSTGSEGPGRNVTQLRVWPDNRNRLMARTAGEQVFILNASKLSDEGIACPASRFFSGPLLPLRGGGFVHCDKQFNHHFDREGNFLRSDNAPEREKQLIPTDDLVCMDDGSMIDARVFVLDHLAKITRRERIFVPGLVRLHDGLLAATDGGCVALVRPSGEIQNSVEATVDAAQIACIAALDDGRVLSASGRGPLEIQLFDIQKLAHTYPELLMSGAPVGLDFKWRRPPLATLAGGLCACYDRGDKRVKVLRTDGPERLVAELQSEDLEGAECTALARCGDHGDRLAIGDSRGSVHVYGLLARELSRQSDE